MLRTVDFDALNDLLAESNRRARRGRAVARSMLVATVALLAFLAYALVLAPPAFIGPMFSTTPEAFRQPIGILIGMAGFVGLATGLLWMWHIVVDDHEPDPRSWRYLHRP